MRSSCTRVGRAPPRPCRLGVSAAVVAVLHAPVGAWGSRAARFEHCRCRWEDGRCGLVPTHPPHVEWALFSVDWASFPVDWVPFPVDWVLFCVEWALVAWAFVVDCAFGGVVVCEWVDLGGVVYRPHVVGAGV